VRIDNFIHISRRNAPVPDVIGINHDVRAVLALIKASGFVGSNGRLQPALPKFLLEEFLQSRLGLGIAAATRVPIRALIGTDKNVMRESGHLRTLNQIVDGKKRGVSKAIRRQSEKPG
jgi:hypothetical protein